MRMATTGAGPREAGGVPRLARWAVGLGVAALTAAAVLLWWTQGSKVFLDTLAAGLAWCL